MRAIQLLSINTSVGWGERRAGQILGKERSYSDNVVIKTNGYKLKVSPSRLELRKFPAMRRVKSLKQ